jgi:hypothetical protein
MRLVAAFACAMMLICIGALPGHAERRVALIIGNEAYKAMPALRNPGRDASEIETTLKRLGFATTKLINADARTLNDALKRFAQSAVGAEVVFVFYSGHGAQFEGRTWLLPVDAHLETKEDINDADLLALDRILATLRDKSAVRIVVLDACRDNPVVDTLNQKLAEARGLKSASTTKGLGRPITAVGDLVVYATQAGAVAADGNGKNSPFTENLLKHLETSDLDVRQVFFRVQEDVARNYAQLPEVSNSIIGEFKLKPAAVTSRPDAAPPLNEATQAWMIVKDTTSIPVLESFIKRYGDSFYAEVARDRIEALKKTQVTVVAPSVRPQPPVAQSDERSQRVVLYEEDPDSAMGKRFVGTAVWRAENVSPSPGAAPEIVVRADVEIPERKMKMTWSLRRNTDQSLPASHTIELMFSLPPDFPSGGIGGVPGILMKQAEQDRGVPLAGLSVKVTNNFFLIGLSAVDGEVKRNSELLKNRGWFDITITYTDGRRAILSLEKGTPGERTFKEALAAWR